MREQGKSIADLAYARIRDFPVTLVNIIDEALLLAAATLKASFPLSYADAFAAATAQIHHAVLLTVDPEFRALEEKELIKVQWL